MSDISAISSPFTTFYLLPLLLPPSCNPPACAGITQGKSSAKTNAPWPPPICTVPPRLKWTQSLSYIHAADAHRHVHSSQSRHDSTCPYSNTCPDSNWGQRKETTGWLLSCARGKGSFPHSSFTTHYQMELPNGTLEERAGLTVALWTPQCNLANLNLSGNGGCSVFRQGKRDRESILKKKHACFQHPEGAILVLENCWYLL